MDYFEEYQECFEDEEGDNWCPIDEADADDSHEPIQDY